jgi:phosphatidylglycerol:prolipoprotein diacylglycerol transferase
MFPIINLGPLSLPAPQLILLIGLWLGSTLSERRAKKFGRNSEILLKIITISIIAGILGARISYIARNPSAFQGHWLSVFSLNPALLDPLGGILIAIVSGYFVAARNQQTNLDLLDDLVPLFSVLLASIHLSNFASGSGYGTLSNLPWAIDLWGGMRHPTQLYYLCANLAVMYITLVYKRPGTEIAGRTTILFVILTTGYSVILNTFQDPAGHLLWGFRSTQLLSWLIFTASIIFYNQALTKKDPNEPE